MLTMKMLTLLRWMFLWPPYLGAGIRVKQVSPDLTSLEVQMKLHFWNQNYFGTHFGGSLYSMTDGFFVLMLAPQLGRDYIVWDKAASIRFKKPGKGTVRAHFELTKEVVAKIKAQADTGEKVEPHFTVNILDAENNVVAEVEKILYVRRKDSVKT